MGCQGLEDIPTPHMDSIATFGVRFTDGYATAPVCSPSRAALLTGKYQQRFGFDDIVEDDPDVAGDHGLPADVVTLADRLKAGGYVTAAVGKWHLGFQDWQHPSCRGFDEFFGFPGANHTYFASNARPKDKAGNPVMRGEESVAEDIYLTQAFEREAVSFVTRNASRPFFLYLAFSAVHSPLEAPEEYLEKFAHIEDEKRRTFAGMLSSLDDAVGGVLQALKENGIEENTLLFFISDNGGPTKQTTSSNAPLRGTKTDLYEGGIRVPFFVQWKGRLRPQTSNIPVTTLDVIPTILAAAGIDADATLDGKNLLPLLEERGNQAPERTFYWRFLSGAAIRKGDWKLVRARESMSWELYNLTEDIAESDDLSARYPEKVKELAEDYNRWDRQMAPPAWTAKFRNSKKSEE